MNLLLSCGRKYHWGLFSRGRPVVNDTFTFYFVVKWIVYPSDSIPFWPVNVPPCKLLPLSIWLDNQPSTVNTSISVGKTKWWTVSTSSYGHHHFWILMTYLPAPSCANYSEGLHQAEGVPIFHGWVFLANDLQWTASDTLMLIRTLKNMSITAHRR